MGKPRARRSGRRQKREPLPPSNARAFVWTRDSTLRTIVVNEEAR
jgi:hypothetical protein